MCENPAPSPSGERVARDGAFISRRGTGEGVPTRIDYRIVRGFHTGSEGVEIE
jgi:hypothetical protein